MDHIPNLSDVHTVEDLHISTLKPVLPGFFVPRLADIPQNPILDTLKAKRVAVASSRTKDTANPTILVQQGENPSLSSDLLWETALKPGRKVQIPYPCSSANLTASDTAEADHVLGYAKLEQECSNVDMLPLRTGQPRCRCRNLSVGCKPSLTSRLL